MGVFTETAYRIARTLSQLSVITCVSLRTAVYPSSIFLFVSSYSSDSSYSFLTDKLIESSDPCYNILVMKILIGSNTDTCMSRMTASVSNVGIRKTFRNSQS